MNELLKSAMKSNLDEYKSIPFWSWNNLLDKKELLKQIEDMKSAGMGGFIIHARTGLKDEYLGEKWFCCVDACLKKARELDMQAWIYDENGWPSGFVGGKLLKNEDNRACFLEIEKGSFSQAAYAVFKADEDKGYIRVECPVQGVNEYYNIYLRISPANTDILNPRVVDEFIKETHEKYYARFKESFGRELVGFFTDEPQYYRAATPYTHAAEAEFSGGKEEIKDGLIWLFVHDERGYAFREKYYGILNKLYVENFYKKIYEWCGKHNCKLTGHSVEENALFTQMWGGASVSPTYEYEDVPAIDCLGRACSTQLSSKQVGSVASQLGKKFVLTETFACAGYDVIPKELKCIAEAQYFNGVNKMCQHLYPYSLAGQGKTDHPPVFSPQGNWFEGFKDFNDYFTRLGYIIANTKENCDVAVINPVRDIWLDYIKSEEYEGVKETESGFDLFLHELYKNGITFQLIDERILERYGTTDGDILKVGEMMYDTVIVPKMKNISSKTLAILQQYTGKLCVNSDIQYVDGIKTDVNLHGNISMREIKALTKVKFRCENDNCFMTSRSGEIGDFLFVKNTSMDEKSVVHFKNVANNYVALDLNDLTTQNISETVTLEKGESLILVKDQNATLTKYSEYVYNISENFCVTDITANCLVLDNAKMSKDGSEYSKVRPIQSLFEELLREDFCGEIRVQYSFTSKDIMPLTLIMEKAPYKEILFNGKRIELKQSDFDVNFAEAEVGECLCKGTNIIEYTINYKQHDGVHFALFDPLATESLRNCLYYDVSLEPIYLKGNFIVNENLKIEKREGMPIITSALNKSGYPFFYGSIKMRGKVMKQKFGRTILSVDGRFMMAEIRTNGNKIRFVNDTKGDISKYLEDGENDIEITLYSSLRNLFGPHHYKPAPEPFGVNPYIFTLRGAWKNGELPDEYTPEYNTVPFGVDRILLINKI